MISALEAKGKETPVNKTVAHSTSCQRKYYHEGSGFYLLVMEVVLESFKVFIPYNFILHRGITFNYIHTFNIFKSLKNTSAIGFGVNMVHGHKEDTCFKKCRITLLQLIYRAGEGQSPQSCDSTIPATADHPALFIRIEVRWGVGNGRVGQSKTQKGKQNTTLLHVKVLMPIILLLTSRVELLEMEVF